MDIFFISCLIVYIIETSLIVKIFLGLQMVHCTDSLDIRYYGIQRYVWYKFHDYYSVLVSHKLKLNKRGLLILHFMNGYYEN